MSQYPPPGGPQGFGQNLPPNVPPGGMGPAGYSLPAVTSTSGSAMVSLICGIIGCIPGVSLIAIITGFIGILGTKSPTVKGRGMAVTGLILGIVWLVIEVGLFTVGSTFVHRIMHGYTAERAFAQTYITNLSHGDVKQCALDSTSQISPDQLTSDSAQMKAWGSVQDTTIFAFSLNNNNSKYTGIVSGVCKFTNGQHNFNMTLVKDPTGQLKAESFGWQN